jgi:ECF sigma factor
VVLALPAWLPFSRPLRYEAQDRALPHHELMPDPSRARTVTELLLSWGEGDTAALDRLVPLLYDDLRRVARGHLRRAVRTSGGRSFLTERRSRLPSARPRKRALRWPPMAGRSSHRSVRVGARSGSTTPPASARSFLKAMRSCRVYRGTAHACSISSCRSGSFHQQPSRQVNDARLFIRMSRRPHISSSCVDAREARTDLAREWAASRRRSLKRGR